MLGTYRERSYLSSGECDDSDEESAPPPCKGFKSSSETDETKVLGSKAGQMWADFINEQSLSTNFSGQVAVEQSKISIERDVESYCLSVKQLREKQAQISAKHDHRPKTNIAQKRYSKYKRRNMFKKTVKHTHSGHEGSSTNMVKRATRPHQAFGVANGQKSRKRSRQIAFACKRSDQMKKIIDKSYSVEALLNAEFPVGLPIDELAKNICAALGEKDPQFITSVIMILNEDKALELFNMTREIEAAGGMMVADGSRRRTPGGVFMTLFKTDTDISIEVKESVVKLQKQNVRKLRKAKKHSQKSVVGSEKSLHTLGESSSTTEKSLHTAEEPQLMSK